MWEGDQQYREYRHLVLVRRTQTAMSVPVRCMLSHNLSQIKPKQMSPAKPIRHQSNDSSVNVASDCEFCIISLAFSIFGIVHINNRMHCLLQDTIRVDSPFAKL